MIVPRAHPTYIDIHAYSDIYETIGNLAVDRCIRATIHTLLHLVQNVAKKTGFRLASNV